MSKTLCPKGCGEMVLETYGDGDYTAICGTCLMEGPRTPIAEAAMEEAGRLCYYERRDRMPTLVEYRAHKAKYGPLGGFYWRRWYDVNEYIERAHWGAWGEGFAEDCVPWHGQEEERLQAWFHIDARPVAWPREGA